MKEENGVYQSFSNASLCILLHRSAAPAFKALIIQKKKGGYDGTTGNQNPTV